MSMGGEEIEFEFKNSKRGQEFRLKGPPALVDKYIEKYCLESLVKDTSSSHPVSPASEDVAHSSNAISDFPERPSATSLTEYITKLLNSEWAVKGRTSAEIIEVAKAHGVSSMKHSTLSGILFGLVQDGRVKRNKRPEDARWLYYPSTEFLLSRGR